MAMAVVTVATRLQDTLGTTAAILATTLSVMATEPTEPPRIMDMDITKL